MRAAMMMREVSMTDVEAIVQGYYGDRPVLQRIEDALRAAGVDPETPSHPICGRSTSCIVGVS
jgi:hypothetical protein